MKQVLLALILLHSVLAWASDEDGGSWVIGARSCRAYIDDRKAADWPDTANMAWIAGYLSAYNVWAPYTFDIEGNRDFKSILLWLEDYCKSNSFSDLDKAMKVLILELRPKRHRTAKEAGK